MTRLNGYKKRRIGGTGIDTGNVFRNAAMSVSWVQGRTVQNVLTRTIRTGRRVAPNDTRGWRCHGQKGKHLHHGLGDSVNHKSGNVVAARERNLIAGEYTSKLSRSGAPERRAAKASRTRRRDGSRQNQRWTGQCRRPKETMPQAMSRAKVADGRFMSASLGEDASGFGLG